MAELLDPVHSSDVIRAIYSDQFQQLEAEVSKKDISEEGSLGL